MNYSKVKQLSKSLYGIMEGMSKDDVLPITYDGKEYEVFCYTYKSERLGKDWSIYVKGRYWDGMNIESKAMKPTSMLLYTYDMMSQRTTYKLKIEDIKVGKLYKKNK